MRTIPGTDFPFPAIARTGPPPLATDAQKRQRRGLLAKIHIAKKEMGLSDDQYEMVLRASQVASAADMTLTQLETTVKLLKNYGWKPRKSRKAAALADRLAALRRRCVEIATGMEDGEKRLAGLAQKICGVGSLTWCHDAGKLERLLAVLGSIKGKEEAK